MKKYIVVVGGYGHVGQNICRDLGERYPGQVYAAGRNMQRAEQFSRETGDKVKPLLIDIEKGFDFADDLLDQIGVVVMCLDQTNTAFVRSCFEHGIHYLDVTAHYPFLEQMESLHAEAASGRATAVLSVGLAPGLTNLMARHAVLQMDHTEAIDISIMLGLGDSHGKAAIEWTVDSLNGCFDVVKNGKLTSVSSFSEGRTANFGAELGHRKAYRFPFPDQRILPRTLGVPTASTRLCFDSAPVTRLLAWLKASGFLRLLSIKTFRHGVVKLFGLIQLGEPIFAVKVDAVGIKNGRHISVECLLKGTREAAITAAVAASVADMLYKSELPHGVYHIEQLFDLEQIVRSSNHFPTLEVRIND